MNVREIDTPKNAALAPERIRQLLIPPLPTLPNGPMIPKLPDGDLVECAKASDLDAFVTFPARYKQCLFAGDANPATFNGDFCTLARSNYSRN